MADPHKLRKGARVVVREPDGTTTCGAFQGIIPPNPAGPVRQRSERLVLRWESGSGVSYVPFIEGTTVKHERGKRA